MNWKSLSNSVLYVVDGGSPVDPEICLGDHDVTTAASVDEAYHLMARKKFGAVVLACSLRGALDCCLRIRMSDPVTPLIVSMDPICEEDRDAAIEAGATVCLDRSAELSLLTAIISDLLPSRSRALVRYRGPRSRSVAIV